MNLSAEPRLPVGELKLDTIQRKDIDQLRKEVDELKNEIKDLRRRD